MQITHVTRQFYPAKGGLEDVVLNLATQQCRSGHNVRVITLNRVFDSEERLESAEKKDDIEIVRIPYFGSNRYPIAPKVFFLIKDADIVHVHGIDFFFDFLALTSLIHRKRLIVSTHGGFFHTSFAYKLKRIFFGSVTRVSASRYAFIAASSQHDLELFRSVRKKGIALIANGVDLGKYSCISRTFLPKRIIYFGRLASNKNILSLVPVLHKLRMSDSDWRLTIAGRPMGLRVDDIRKAAEDFGLSDAVYILETPSDKELRQAIEASSIFCSPSFYEGFGLAAVEALSAGLLPILSDIPAHRTTIGTAGQGHLVDFSDPFAVANVISRGWSRRVQDGWDQTSVDRALKGYTWEKVSLQFLDLYEKVLGHTSRRILDVDVRVLEEATALLAIVSAIESRSLMRIAFVNAHLAVLAANDRSVANMLETFYLLNDGIGVDLASMMLYGRSFPANLNGTDFTSKLLDRLKPGARVYLLGASHSVVEGAKKYCEQRWPQHQVVGFFHGFFSEKDDQAVAEMIKRVSPDLVLVGMGCPRQEAWIFRHVPSVCSVGLGVGALFDFQAGRVGRAPLFIRRIRLEWLFRLLLEPRRLWRRYIIGNASFISRSVDQWIRGERA